MPQLAAVVETRTSFKFSKGSRLGSMLKGKRKIQMTQSIDEGKLNAFPGKWSPTWAPPSMGR